MSAPVNDLRSEHDAVLTRLSARQSTLHFAHAAVSFFIASILAGAAVKLSLDKVLEWAPPLVVPAAVLAAIAFVYSVTRLVLGLRVLRTEVQEFERLKALRRELKLDEPPALLTAP